MEILGIIPARYASTRFPGKPLADIFGKPMIQHVYERVSQSLKYTVVATDDQRIFEVVKSFGGQVVMTCTEHNSGTDRCAEALQLFEKEQQIKIDAAINIQGDEPFIAKEQIDQVAELLKQGDAQIATLLRPITDSKTLFNPNCVKCVINKNQKAIYFSRNPIPYFRGVDESEWLKKHTYYLHVGLYGYKTKVLREITRLSKSLLETAESLEQLRWIENGYSIHTATTTIESIGIDTPDDLQEVLKNKNL